MLEYLDSSSPAHTSPSLPTNTRTHAHTRMLTPMRACLQAYLFHMPGTGMHDQALFQ